MQHDASDILGHTSLPVVHGKNSGVSSFSMGQSVFIGVALLVVYIVAKRLWKRALLWQERSYKLATRRRHGIPDSDLRPFNVAYSAAMTRAREEEGRNQVKSNPLLRPQGRLLDQHHTQPEQPLRYRTVPQQKLGAHPETSTGPMTFKASASKSKPLASSNHEHISMNHYVPSQPIAHPAQASSSTTPVRSLTRQAAYGDIEDWTSDNEGKKRSLDEQEDDEHELKKLRVDGDEDAGSYNVGHTALKRGSKRGFGEEEEDSEELTETKKFRGKRARKVSREKARQSHVIDDNMDIDDEEFDQITELTSRSRGKKRDRAEAGSTFGGDDDDSAAEHEPEDDIKARRRQRKRRTVAKRKSEASHARGKKRDRDTDDEKSDQESEDGSQGKVSRKKRGKRGSDRHDVPRSDISMDESINSTRGKVRAIGEEWESNGIKYKVGLNGQRLRQALVKQARQKFVMPIDSQHPDRKANVQICIECWLTEEEYQEKKAERMLAWQDGTPPRQEEPVNNLSLDVAEPQLSQSVAGKNLLWGSSTASTPTASPPSHSPATETPPESAKARSYRDSYRHSIATTVGLPISPFRTSQIPTIKRIASTTRVSLSPGLNGSPGLSDSTNGTPRTINKVFSKWEKQELEAQAIMKMREANRKKELEREAKLKEEKENAERAAAERARCEKERLDRERAEKERIEREKAEAERKSKEVTQVPKITVTAPSSENVTAPTTFPSTNVPNPFSMMPTGSTSAKPMENPTTSQSTSVPSFSSNIPVSTSAPAQAELANGPFNFSAPSGNPNIGNAGASSSASKLSAFSFPTVPSSTDGQKAEGSGLSNSGAPLLSRIGSQAPEPWKQAYPPQQSFSFAKPNGPNSTTNPRSQAIQSPSAQPNPSATSSSSTNAPPLKFTFNVPSKPTAPNPPAVASTTSFPSSSSSSLHGALGSDQQKTTTSTPNAPTFNFKIPTTPASASTSANTTSTTPAAATPSAPKFTFATSAFNPSTSSSGSQEQNKEPLKSSFGNTNTTSAFSGSTGTPFGRNTSLAFQGQNKEPFKSSFGDNTSVFANNASASQSQKSVFDGGSTNTTAFSNNTGTSPSPFGANSSASQTQKSAFDGGSTNTTAFSNNIGTGPSPFGANSSASQTQKSAFDGGNTNTTSAFSTNTGTSPSPFGLPQTKTENVFGGGVFGSNPTETPKSVFGNGTSTSTLTTSAPSNTTNTTTTPKFSFAVNNQTSTPAATTTTPSGTPASGSGAFSFGFGQTAAATSSPFGAPSPFGNNAAGGTSSSNGTAPTPSVFGGGVFEAPASQEQK
ncbi:hypothetical protein BYT27DRAFT_7191526 [Phlegmacium glaucopus]|nr:hypothetical protein BYT27DRAFT_7191526 [Phlegmacium glaucopus]